MDTKRSKINKNNDKQKKKKDLDVPLVKLEEQPTSLPAMGNITCWYQHEHFSICCPERLSIMCRHNPISRFTFRLDNT